jgi:hypothetical protein
MWREIFVEELRMILPQLHPLLRLHCNGRVKYLQQKLKNENIELISDFLFYFYNLRINEKSTNHVVVKPDSTHEEVETKKVGPLH